MQRSTTHKQNGTGRQQEEEKEPQHDMGWLQESIWQCASLMDPQGHGNLQNFTNSDQIYEDKYGILADNYEAYLRRRLNQHQAN